MAKQKKIQEESQSISPGQSLKAAAKGLSARMCAIIVFSFALVIYFNATFNSYNLDDELVTRGQRLTSRGISAIPDIFTQPYYKDNAGYEYEYRPMVLVTFAIENSFFGETAAVSHVINVLLYAFMCMLLFYLLLHLFADYSILLPFIISLLFAAHPIHTEVVASIKNRDEILALLFGICSMWYAMHYAKHAKWGQLLLVPVFFVLGMLSKPTTFTFAILAPIAIVMFTATSLPRILLLTTVVALPAIILSRLPTLWHFAVLGIGIYTAVIGLYVIRNKEEVFAVIKNYVKTIAEAESTNDIPTGENSSLASNSSDFSFLKRPEFGIPYAVIALGAAALSVWGITIGDAWFATIPLLVLGILYSISPKGGKLILITAIIQLTVYMLVRLNNTHPVFEGLLIGFIATQLLTTDKRFRITAALNMLIYAAVMVLFRQHTIFLGILFFAGLFHRRLMIVSILLILASLAAGIGRELQQTVLELKYISYPVIYLVFYLLWSKRSAYLQQVLVLLIPVTAMFYFQFSTIYFYTPAKDIISNTYSNVRNIEAPEIAPVKAVRPLKYLEYPFKGDEPFSVRFGTSMDVLGKYMKLIIVPYPMSFYYGFAYIDQLDFFNLWPIAVLLIYIAILIVGLYYVRSRPVLAYGILFYLIAILPFTGLLVAVPGMMGDRFLLVPSLGFVIVLGYVLFLIFKQSLDKQNNELRKLATPMKVTLAVILVAYSGITIARNADWKNHVHLFSKDVNVVENSVQAHNLLGVHLLIASTAEKQLDKQVALRQDAIMHLKRALELYPPYLNTSFDIGRTYGMMAEQYKALGMSAQARGAYDSALVYFNNTVKIDTTFYTPYYSMGIIEQGKGNLDGAAKYFEKYIAKFPDHLESYTQLSYTYFLQKKYDEAISVNKRYLKRSPNTYEPLVNIGKTFLETGNVDSAIVYIEKAYELNRNNATMVKFMYELSSRTGDTKRMQYYGTELNRVGGRP